MIFRPTAIPGACIVEMERRTDDRGFFARAWCRRDFEAHGLNPTVAQINVGFSPRKGTLRGLHFQVSPHEEAKLIRCTRGAIYDVIVDLRPTSPTHRKWIGVELTEHSPCMLYVPEHCAHGYQTLVDNTEIYYQTSQFYAPDAAKGVRFDDPAFNIDWPLPVWIISESDRSHPPYA